MPVQSLPTSKPLRAVVWQSVDRNRLHLLTDRLTTPWEVVCLSHEPDLYEVHKTLGTAQALIANTFPGDWRGIATRLKLVHCPGAGIDAFDLSALPPGCTLCNVHEHEVATAEYVMLAVLSFSLQMERHAKALRRGQWSGSGRLDGEFHSEACGKTLGLVGFGHTGRAVARRAAGFGMKIVAVSAHPEPDPDLMWCKGPDRLDDLLSQSDFVVIACPLNERTRGLIGERELRLLRPNAYLINPARAEIIDEVALYDGLREKWFAGAALDVWYQYPSHPDQRMHGSRFPFHELDNVITTPHFSAWSHEMIERRYCRLAENLDHLARNEPLERVVYRAPGGQ